MAYENFIPTVWAEAINRELEKALVYAEGCNRQYDGEVKAMGDTVRILGVGRPTITTTTDGDHAERPGKRGGQQRDACRPADQLFQLQGG